MDETINNTKTLDEMSNDEVLNYVLRDIDDDDYYKFNNEYDREAILDAIIETKKHPVFGKQRIEAAVMRIKRVAYKMVGQREKEETYEETYGYWLGGTDWRPSKNSKRQIPDKQSFLLLTSNGIETFGLFGHGIGDVELTPFTEYRILYDTYESSRGKIYATVKGIEVIEENNRDEFLKYMKNLEKTKLRDIDETMLYKPIVTIAKVHKVMPNYDLIETDEELPVFDENGNPLYDENGKRVYKKRWKKSDEGTHPIQSTLDDRFEDIHVGTWKLHVPREKDDPPLYVDVKFYNKRLGRHHIEIKAFLNDSIYDSICSLEDPEESAEFLTDEIKADGEFYYFVTVPKRINKYEKNGEIITNITLEGYFVMPVV